MGLITQFIAILSGIWMLAVANKIVSDTWEVLFSEKYKSYLTRLKEHRKKIWIQLKEGRIYIKRKEI
jgi:hypothetical protein